MNYKNKFNSDWITGFVDAEGCFTVSIFKINRKTKWGIQASFQIELHSRDLDLLLQIKSFFNNVGNIYIKKTRNKVQYKISKLNELTNIIIPHFENYPLLTQKHNDFILFKKIVLLINNKEHLTQEGLIKIISLKASLNHGLSDQLITFFPEIKKRDIIQSVIPRIINYNWIAGFVSGDGCFFIRVYKYKNTKLSNFIGLNIRITQHSKDEMLINIIASTLKYGNIYKKKDRNIVELEISIFDDIYTKIIPLFKEYKIGGVKAFDFQDFCQAAELINNKAHLTQEGLEKIRQIKAGMNRGRKYKEM